MMEFHELAQFFPLMAAEEMAELVADIRENGLLEPIVTFDGAILDGRNRYRACQVADREPQFTEYNGDCPATYVISKNIRRRHLTKTQQSVILLDMKPAIQEDIKRQDEATPRDESGRFEPRGTLDPRGRWSERVARGTGVGEKTLRRVDRVSREAPDLIPKMRAGEMSAVEAEQEVRRRKARESIARSDVRAKKKKRQEEPREVKTYLDALSDFRVAVREAIDVAAYGKFSPEAARFVQRWHDGIRALMEKVEDEWP